MISHSLCTAICTVIWYIHVIHVYIDGGRILGDNSSAISLKLTTYKICAILSDDKSNSVKPFNSCDITSNKTSLETLTIGVNMETHGDY